jgi:hypothetical protein
MKMANYNCFSYKFLLLQRQLFATFDSSYSGVLPTRYHDMFLSIAYDPNVLTRPNTCLSILHYCGSIDIYM